MIIDNNNDNTIVEPPPVVYQSKFDGRSRTMNLMMPVFFAVMFDNAPGARPQAGLSNAKNSLRDTGRKCRDSVYGHF